MHKCEYTDRIEIKNHLLTRVVTASYENKKGTVSYSDEVLKHNENDISVCRHVYYSRLMGFGISFNGEINPYGEIENDNYYAKTLNEGKNHLNLYVSNGVSQKDIQTVVSKYPAFAEIFNNVKFYCNESLIDSIYYWKNHKENATKLLKANKQIIQRTERFYSLTEKVQNEIIQFCNENKFGDIPLSYLLQLMKVCKANPSYNAESLLSIIHGSCMKKDILSFYCQTKEYRNLTEPKKEEFCKLFNNEYFLYKKFSRLIKLSEKYSKTSLTHLYDIFINRYSFVNKETMIDFYITYNDEFKYVCKKYNFNSSEEVKKAFTFWTKYRNETEMLLSYELTDLAYNEDYYAQTKENKKKVISFILKYKNIIRNLRIGIYDLPHIYKYADSDITDEEMIFIFNEFTHLRNVDVDSQTVQFLMKHPNIEIDEYNQYIKDCKELNHDITDPYWKFPKSFTQKRAKIEKEKGNTVLLSEVSKNEEYVNAIKMYLKYNKPMKKDGYEIFIPKDIPTIRYQANYLHQCLINCDYVSKVIKKNCILIFVTKGKIPVATCEIKLDKKIVQYRTTHNGNTTEEQRELMNNYLDNFKVA